jgi:hypothetical protein
VSLRPLSFDDAMKALLAVRVEPSKPRKKKPEQ